MRYALSWTFAIAVIAALGYSLYRVEFADLPGESGLYLALAEATGITLFEPAGRAMAGLLIGLSMLLILLPGTRRTGASLSLILSGAMVGAHASPILGTPIPPGSEHFWFALGVCVASLMILFVHPGADD